MGLAVKELKFDRRDSEAEQQPADRMLELERMTALNSRKAGQNLL